MTHPDPQDSSTPTSPDAAPAKQHGDPLLAASEGAQEGTEGSRHGADATQASRERQQES